MKNKRHASPCDRVFVLPDSIRRLDLKAVFTGRAARGFRIFCLVMLPLMAPVACSPHVRRPAKPPADESSMTLDELRAMRKASAGRRRIVYNNDGGDALYLPNPWEGNAEGFLGYRTVPLTGTLVNAIFYCPASSGFGFFTHNTQVGTLITRQGVDYGIRMDTRNIAPKLIDQGTDVLEAVVDFARHNAMEAFFSMRMNDTHDNRHRPDRPFMLFPPLKEEHPEWLVGHWRNGTPFGRWSSVDYAVPEIRELAFLFVEEACRKYDIDGIELDFFRHPTFFKSTSFGGVAGEEELEMMTGLMRRIRAMTEEEGLRRGRPILVAVRTPDSTEYCRALGLDIERWAREGLADLFVMGGYFQLNHWEYSAAFGRRHGVEVLPDFSESRVRGETRFSRRSHEAYRGRAMKAWAAGFNSLYYYNLQVLGLHSSNVYKGLLSETGDPALLAPLEKLYFVTILGGEDARPERWLAQGDQYYGRDLLSPDDARTLLPGEPLTLEVVVGDDPEELRKLSLHPRIGLHLFMPTLSEEDRLEHLRVSMNEIELTDGLLKNGWIDYAVPADILRQGRNRVEIVAGPNLYDERKWSLIYEGSRMPAPPWVRDRGSPRTSDAIVDDALFIANRGQEQGDFLYYRYRWDARETGRTIVEAGLRIQSGFSLIIVDNGVHADRLVLWPDRIELFENPRHQYAMDTTQAFHTYRIETEGRDILVYVDGVLRIDGTGAYRRPSPLPGKGQVAFGAADSTGQGESFWRQVHIRNPGGVEVSLRDLVISVHPAE